MDGTPAAVDGLKYDKSEEEADGCRRCLCGVATRDSAASDDVGAGTAVRTGDAGSRSATVGTSTPMRPRKRSMIEAVCRRCEGCTSGGQTFEPSSFEFITTPDTITCDSSSSRRAARTAAASASVSTRAFCERCLLRLCNGEFECERDEEAALLLLSVVSEYRLRFLPLRLADDSTPFGSPSPPPLLPRRLGGSLLTSLSSLNDALMSSLPSLRLELLLSLVAYRCLRLLRFPDMCFLRLFASGDEKWSRRDFSGDAILALSSSSSAMDTPLSSSLKR
jgi:hypothetical protein